LGTETSSIREPSRFADIAAAAAKTGNDSIVVEFTAIFSGGAASGPVSANNNKTVIAFKTVTVR
jgi:hypothetical protein